MLALTRRTTVGTFQKPKRRALDGKVMSILTDRFLKVENL
jgi:hypothetical protein